MDLFFSLVMVVSFLPSESIYLQRSRPAWLESRNWVVDTCGVSNEVQNIGTLMQYARDQLGQPEWEAVLTELYQWLDEHQDPQSGLWGPRFDSAKDLSLGIQSAYHFWMLYFYDRRPVRHAEAALASCLRSQTTCGGFGFTVNTSACERGTTRSSSPWSSRTGTRMRATFVSGERSR